jgi:hypothetical protein
MNAYLEQPGVWHDFHRRFISRIADALAMQIRPEYVTAVDDHIYIHELSGDERVYFGRPDIAISHQGGAAIATAGRSITAPAFGRIQPGVDSGQRMPVDDLPACDYVVMVSRSYDRPRVELWPLSLRDALPLIPVPLRLGRTDATLDLGPLLRDQFDAAGYEDYVYRTSPLPPLAGADADWAARLTHK